ncbi:MarR family winged helix-turn-helix transcriptional regulator [Zunongwangia sp. HRR-M8]|uniref:MarR family winged helix-turn-helix transcriptional regulator n=1 Tax=Zunongwangia sp. HRR-M8 TaxID=3015170 RepID=UPI0022DD7446|nr:MarR family transcriptional regulator [Zunongwangia sp. HRR-M8]WBL21710.1 MarR family transcriptional regulator [Zunongwangia sp. HRR-M8]
MKTEELLKTNHLADSKKLVINIMLCADKATSMMNEALKPHEISMQQFNVLRILRGQKGKPANLSTIQDRMVNKMSNTTRLVDKLIKKNLVKRCVCEENRRKVEIIITKDGLALLEILDPLVQKVENNFVNALSQKDVAELNNSLEKIRN